MAPACVALDEARPVVSQATPADTPADGVQSPHACTACDARVGLQGTCWKAKWPHPLAQHVDGAWTAPHLLALSLVDIVGGCWGEALAGNWVGRAPLLLLRGLARPPTGKLWARAAAAQPQRDRFQDL